MIEAATPAAVPAEGGAISIDYEVKNPVEGKRLSAQSDDAWVKELTVGDEAVTARLEKNLLADPRTATVTLRYDGAEAVKVSVVQEGYLPFLIQVADITMSDARITVYPEEEGMYIAAVDFAEGMRRRSQRRTRRSSPNMPPPNRRRSPSLSRGMPIRANKRSILRAFRRRATMWSTPMESMPKEMRLPT